MTTTTDEAALLAAIRTHPAEDTPRLVYADWLDENVGDVTCPRCRGAATTDGLAQVKDWEWRSTPTDVRDWVWRSTRIDCQTCSGTGRTSDGRREMAEFIRIDIEIERLHRSTPLFDSAAALAIVHGSIRDLRQRQRPLWREWSRRWFGWGTGTDNFGSALTPNEVDPRVRRGFVAEVQMPVAAFLSAAKGLFSTHPIERVVLTDREPGGIRYGVTVDLPGPYQTGPGAGRVGYGTLWRWFMENEMAGGVADNPSVLPGAIWRLFHDYPPHSTSILRRTIEWEFASRDEALVALSHACVAYGRGLAGLPPLEAAG